MAETIDGMVKRTNFGDDIFFLTMKVKNLRDGCKLELSPDLFTRNISDELRFIFAALARINSTIRASAFAINRTEYLKDLLRLHRNFAELIDSITGGEAAYSAMLGEGKAALIGISEKTRSDIDELLALLTRLGETNEEGTDIISEEEYRILLSDGET